MGFLGGGSNPRRQRLSPTVAVTKDPASRGMPFGWEGKRKRWEGGNVGHFLERPSRSRAMRVLAGRQLRLRPFLFRASVSPPAKSSWGGGKGGKLCRRGLQPYRISPAGRGRAGEGAGRCRRRGIPKREKVRWTHQRKHQRNSRRKKKKKEVWLVWLVFFFSLFPP